jgi:hypothetical protein
LPSVSRSNDRGRAIERAQNPSAPVNRHRGDARRVEWLRFQLIPNGGVGGEGGATVVVGAARGRRFRRPQEIGSALG